MSKILRPIYVEKNEGVGSILGRIQKTSENDLALVFPPDSVVFHNVLEIEFLKRELDRINKDAVIITSDPAQAELAKGLGFKSSDDIKKDGETNKFLEDFYKKKEEKQIKTISPLIKSQSQVSDIISRKTQDKNSIKLEVKPIEQKPEPQKFEPIQIDTEKKEQEEEIESRVEPISLTEEDIEQEAKQKEKKTSFFHKFKPKISFSRIKKASLNKAAKSPLKKIFILLLFLAVGVFVLTATFVFPKADVLVSPTKEKVQLNVDVVFNPEVKAVDFEKNIVPGQIFKITKTISKEFSTTQEEDIKRKANGVITIYNAYSSESQTLVETTRFKSPDGKIFHIIKTITVPGAKIENGNIIPSSIEANVIADEAGEDYNIGPSRFDIPGFEGTDKYKGFYGESKKNMTEGLIKKGLVVGKDDVANAEAELKDQLIKAAKEELKTQLGEDLKLIEESLVADVVESVPSPSLGEPADKFTLNLKALAQVFAYKESDLNDLIEEKIALKISDKRLTLPKTQKVDFQYEKVDFSSSEASFNLIVEEDISWKIDEDRLKEILAGKNEIEAQEAIKLFSEITSARVSLWPFWLKNIPRDFRKIRITIDY